MEDIKQLIDAKIEQLKLQIEKLVALKVYIVNTFEVIPFNTEEQPKQQEEEETDTIAEFLKEHGVKSEIQLCKKFGVSFSDFKRLLREGMSPKDALKNAQIKE